MSMVRVRSADLWTLLAIAILTGMAVAADAPSAVRLPLGLLTVLLVPGYALISALFPRSSDLDLVERLAVSFAASISLIPLIGLLLSRSLLGITLTTALTSVLALTVLFAAIAFWRSRGLPADELPAGQIQEEFQDWLAESPGQARAVAAAVVLIAGALFASTVLARIPSTTEFYVLGPAGLAQNYVREVTLGQPVAAPLTVVNREGRAVSYRVEVRDGDQVLAAQDAGSLAGGGSVEIPLSFTPQHPDTPRSFDILLFADGRSDPYRTLRLLVNVRPPDAPALRGAQGDGR